LKKDCITHKRDYRNYPVFTKDDIEGIKKSSRERSWRFNLMPVGPLIKEHRLGECMIRVMTAKNIKKRIGLVLCFLIKL